MPVNASQFDQRLLPVFLDGRDHLTKDDWFDAHTHIGQNDPDGRKATPEEITQNPRAASVRLRAVERVNSNRRGDTAA